jgi:hypothetical protein
MLICSRSGYCGARNLGVFTQPPILFGGAHSHMLMIRDFSNWRDSHNLKRCYRKRGHEAHLEKQGQHLRV